MVFFLKVYSSPESARPYFRRVYKMKKEKTKKEKEKVSSIGGQALMEGVMMRGKTAMAMAVRSPNGDILLETKRFRSSRRWYSKVPVLRGLIAFFVSLFTGVDTLLKSASVSAPEDEVPGKGWMTFSVILGLVLGVGLFILLPSLLSTLLFDTWLKIDNILLSSLLEGVLRILIFVLYLFLVSRIKDIRRTFMYHGAEHRTINCYEKGMDMTVENVQKCSTRHNRCGTTFLFFVMIVSILVFSLANWLFSLMGLSAENYNKVAYIFIKFGIRLALLPFVAGLSYELLKFLAFLPDNKFTNILRAPGLALQRLTTYPPTDDMAEVALKSFLAVADMDGDGSIAEVSFGEIPITEVRAIIAESLKNTNADSSEPDWILCDALKKRRSELRDVTKIDLAQYRRISEILSRRKNCEPLWYVLGYTDFYKNRIIVNNSVLIPRPETEILCEQAIKRISGADNASVLDLCTGSGCIALAVAKNTNATVTASDAMKDALKVAAQNLRGSAELVESDLFENLSGRKFDFILSNPPYIAKSVLDTLDSEVKDYEPLIALDGGEDGLDFYRRIALDAPGHLNDGGTLMLEIGYDQAESVSSLLKESFENIEVIKDYGGNDRVVVGTRK